MTAALQARAHIKNCWKAVKNTEKSSTASFHQRRCSIWHREIIWAHLRAVPAEDRVAVRAVEMLRSCGYDESLLAITLRGYTIYAFSYLLAGFNIFGSAFFTALNNGVVSAVISFLRTIVFQCASVLLLPLAFSAPLDGVWFSIIVSELLSLAVTVVFLIAKRKKYGY